MASNDSEALRSRFDAFSRRLDARIKEFRERGELSTDQTAASGRLRERGEAIGKKLKVAIEKKDEADILKYEFERDLNNLAQDFEDFLRQIDAAADTPSRGTS
jgi:hypothetical protein